MINIKKFNENLNLFNDLDDMFDIFIDLEGDYDLIIRFDNNHNYIKLSDYISKSNSYKNFIENFHCRSTLTCKIFIEKYDFDLYIKIVSNIHQITNRMEKLGWKYTNFNSMGASPKSSSKEKFSLFINFNYI